MNIVFTHLDTLKKDNTADIVKETDFVQIIHLAEGINHFNFEQQMVNLLGYIKPRHDVIVTVPSIDSDIKAAVKNSMKHFHLKSHFCSDVKNLVHAYRKFTKTNTTAQ